MDVFDSLIELLAIPSAETFFLDPPVGVHAVWDRKIIAYGSDFDNELRRYFISLDILEPYELQNSNVHTILQNALDDLGIKWTKEERIFYVNFHTFATTYTFEFTESLE